MSRRIRQQRQLERIASMPAVISSSLEAAFLAIERPARRYADSETPTHPPARGNGTVTQAGR